MISWKGLPFISGYFKDENTLVGGGFDKKVAIFKRKGSIYKIL
jgi:hypothetical protein